MFSAPALFLTCLRCVVRQACRAKGLLVITAGKGDILRLVPPLIVTAEEVDQAIAILQEALLCL
jgi:acetylornithine aminotransferase